MRRRRIVRTGGGYGSRGPTSAIGGILGAVTEGLIGHQTGKLEREEMDRAQADADRKARLEAARIARQEAREDTRQRSIDERARRDDERADRQLAVSQGHLKIARNAAQRARAGAAASQRKSQEDLFSDVAYRAIEANDGDLQKAIGAVDRSADKRLFGEGLSASHFEAAGRRYKERRAVHPPPSAARSGTPGSQMMEKYRAVKEGRSGSVQNPQPAAATLPAGAGAQLSPDLEEAFTGELAALNAKKKRALELGSDPEAVEAAYQEDLAALVARFRSQE